MKTKERLLVGADYALLWTTSSRRTLQMMGACQSLGLQRLSSLKSER